MKSLMGYAHHWYRVCSFKKNALLSRLLSRPIFKVVIASGAFSCKAVSCYTMISAVMRSRVRFVPFTGARSHRDPVTRHKTQHPWLRLDARGGMQGTASFLHCKHGVSVGVRNSSASSSSKTSTCASVGTMDDEREWYVCSAGVDARDFEPGRGREGAGEISTRG